VLERLRSELQHDDLIHPPVSQSAQAQQAQAQLQAHQNNPKEPRPEITPELIHSTFGNYTTSQVKNKLLSTPDS
jgi:hypothetical protein